MTWGGLEHGHDHRVHEGRGVRIEHYGDAFDARRDLSGNSSDLLAIDASIMLNPVMLPPGWDRFAMKREPIGSATNVNTIGMVCVSRASTAVVGVEVASSTSGCRPT